jgi:hypothetical protein
LGLFFTCTDGREQFTWVRAGLQQQIHAVAAQSEAVAFGHLRSFAFVTVWTSSGKRNQQKQGNGQLEVPRRRQFAPY